MIYEVKAGKTVLAKLIKLKKVDLGVYPMSLDSASLQLMVMNRPKDYKIQKHGHKKTVRKTNTRQKVLVLIKGRMIVTICSEKGKDCGVCILEPGDCLYLLRGGYSIEIREKSLFYEIKNGPHFEDKVMFV
jgi:hypothetical protein